MNHLSQLETVHFDLLDHLKEPGERAVFAAFKKKYNELAPDRRIGEPTFQVATAQLPPSGWRPLHDETLLRFLKADRRGGRFQPEASLKRLAAALKWRKDIALDDLIASPPPGLKTYHRLRVRSWMGLDHSGRPVQFERMGEFLCEASAKFLSNDEWVRYYACDQDNVFKEMRMAANQVGKSINTFAYVGDFGGFSWTIAPRVLANEARLITHLASVVERHYPEVAGNIIIINAGHVFKKLFEVFKLGLDPVTVGKIEVYSEVPLDRLLKLMPKSSIPTEYGGSCSRPYPHVDPRGEGQQEDYRTEPREYASNIAHEPAKLQTPNGKTKMERKTLSHSESFLKITVGLLIGVLASEWHGDPQRLVPGACMVVIVSAICVLLAQ